jgi:hypothetical protein
MHTRVQVEEAALSRASLVKAQDKMAAAVKALQVSLCVCNVSVSVYYALYVHAVYVLCVRVYVYARDTCVL